MKVERGQSVYLAARFDRQHELRSCADQLANIGVEVTSSWILGGDTPYAECTDAQLRQFAAEDIADIERADVFVAFTEDAATAGYQSGGRHVELGMALVMGKDIVLIGPRENVFHHIGYLAQFDTWAAFMQAHRSGGPGRATPGTGKSDVRFSQFAEQE